MKTIIASIAATIALTGAALAEDTPSTPIAPNFDNTAAFAQQDFAIEGFQSGVQFLDAASMQIEFTDKTENEQLTVATSSPEALQHFIQERDAFENQVDQNENNFVKNKSYSDDSQAIPLRTVLEKLS